MGRVLKANYFANKDFMDEEVGHNSSYLWRSILWGRDLLKAGVRWRIGNGCRVRLFNDPWLPRPFSFKPTTSHSEANSNLRVVDLMAAESWSTMYSFMGSG